MELLSRNESVFGLSLLLHGYIHRRLLPSLQRVRSGTLTAEHTKQDGGGELLFTQSLILNIDSGTHFVDPVNVSHSL